MALGNTPGVVEKIAIGTPLLDLLQDRSFWMVDVRVKNPYFDETFGQKIEFLRIGIRTEKDSQLGIYKEPLTY